MEHCEKCVIVFEEKNKIDCCDAECECHVNPTPQPAWEEETIGQKATMIIAEALTHGKTKPMTEDASHITRKLIALLKEERTATLCTRCHNPFQDHHWRISHRGEHYHTGCLEKTPARVTQLIEATRAATLREVFKELEKHNFKNLQVEDSIIKRLQHKLTSEL